MNDIFDSFFSEYPLFVRPTRLVFNTPVKDMMPSVYKKTDTGYKATIKTLGLDKVDITTFDSGIKVKGENEINGYKYNVDIELPIAEDVMDDVVEIIHETKCGITTIELILDRPEKRKPKITSR